MPTPSRIRAVAACATLAAALALTGCAAAKDAEPEVKTFPVPGGSLNVKAHGSPADLVATDREDIQVTRWFDTGWGTDPKSSGKLKDGVLELVAACDGFAHCDVRFRIEVPEDLKVLRDGRPTDLKGSPPPRRDGAVPHSRVPDARDRA
ncbi:hypothetical protein [Streptomyces cremeus]|uniref:Lipoprotein n=1 Tax=Streptomyces cremeus TaxID=66881 RepID=A0ABV5P692_STRCM